MVLHLTNHERARSPARTAPGILTLLWLACGFLPGVSLADEDWTPLFNGRDLEGWAVVNAAPGTFTARDGKICSTGKPIGLLRTTRQYENFVLELEWRHLAAGGNAGLFVWSQPLTAPGTPFAQAIEVQILDGRETENYTSDGDVFAIHGATMVPDRPHPNGWMRCLPSEKRCRPAGEWNHYRVTCQDGSLKLEVNGKEVSGASACSPRQGYICLESEGSPAEFRKLRIRELPTTHPRPEEIAEEARDFRTLYTGVDLSGWRVAREDTAHWIVDDWKLVHDGKSPADTTPPRTEREYRDFTLVCDWRLTARPVARERVSENQAGDPVEEKAPDAGSAAIRLRGSERLEIAMSSAPIGSGGLRAAAKAPRTSLDDPMWLSPRVPADRKPGEWNRFVITLRGDTLTIDLNGQRVAEGWKIEKLPASGPIELVSDGAPFELASLLLLEHPEREAASGALPKKGSQR